VPDADLPALYNGATLLTTPSFYEGFGLPLIEAMSVECPVLCSNTSSFPEVAGPAAEFFDPNSEESLIDAMENIIFDETKKVVLKKEGLLRAKIFSWDKCATETETVYKKILGKKQDKKVNS
jgi:glycosyltransferase involved in cell wall biosynthesis